MCELTKEGEALGLPLSLSAGYGQILSVELNAIFFLKYYLCLMVVAGLEAFHLR